MQRNKIEREGNGEEEGEGGKKRSGGKRREGREENGKVTVSFEMFYFEYTIVL